MGTPSQWHSRAVAWLVGLSTPQLILTALALTYAGVVPAVLVTLALPGEAVGGPGFEKRGLVSMLLFGCVIAPLVETALHQWACLRLLSKLRCPVSAAIVVSALLFGLGHTYSIAYVAMTFWTGLVLAAVFVIEDRRAGRPFLATAAVHAMRNGITTLYFVFMAA
jgi:membrane protease YdiL (CAAX protease family)